MNGIRRQRLFPGKNGLCGVWGCAGRSQNVTGELNTEMSATPIAQTGNALSKADLNAEFPKFLRGRSNQNADETAVWKTAFSSKGFIT
jgi:hypothetical protein